MLLAMSDSAGTLLTVAIIVILVIVTGIAVITSDTNWFD